MTDKTELIKREGKIRHIIRANCCYLDKPICPIENNSACDCCNKEVAQLLALIKEALPELAKEAGYVKLDDYKPLLETYQSAIKDCPVSLSRVIETPRDLLLSYIGAAEVLDKLIFHPEKDGR